MNPGRNRHPEQVFAVSENVNRNVIGLEGYLMDRFGHSFFLLVFCCFGGYVRELKHSQKSL